MRDLILALIIFGSLPLILARPWIGIIMWNWISFMNPHRLSWGFMYDIPIAMIIGVTALVAWILSKEDRHIEWNSVTILIALFMVWSTISTIFAVAPDDAFHKWKSFFKIILMVFVAISLIKKDIHLRVLIWTTVVSIGFFSFKGGIFTVMSGGSAKVYGPPATAIEDNNGLALATLMIIPLMVYLAQTTPKKWVKLGLYTAVLFSLISVIGSYSRGGFLGMLAIALILWLRSKRKMIIAIAVGTLLVTSVSLIPQKWVDRMNTIGTYEEDSSAVGRLEIWGHAIRVANGSPILGGGFGVFTHEPTRLRYSPEVIMRSAHSNYFEVLAQHGYIGLVIFLLLGIFAFVTVSRIKRLTKNKPGFESEQKFANYTQISLVAYAVSGSFLNFSTYDLYYTILALIAIQHTLVVKKLKAPTNDTETSPMEAVRSALPQLKPGPAPARSFLREPSS